MVIWTMPRREKSLSSSPSPSPSSSSSSLKLDIYELPIALLPSPSPSPSSSPLPSLSFVSNKQCKNLSVPLSSPSPSPSSSPLSPEPCQDKVVFIVIFVASVPASFHICFGYLLSKLSQALEKQMTYCSKLLLSLSPVFILYSLSPHYTSSSSSFSSSSSSISQVIPRLDMTLSMIFSYFFFNYQA